MARKILIAECKQEVSTFNPFKSHYEDFQITRQEDVLRLNRGGALEVAGALSVFDAQDDIEVVPTYSARSITSGGTLADTDFHRIAHEFLEAVRSAPDVDGIYFAMHGAMAAESEDDPEGYLLAETRKIVGEAMPIVLSLDLHGILTDRMLQHSNAVAAYHTYPHVDFFETGVRAARLLLRILAGEIRPVTARVKIPALVRGDELKTATGLFGGPIDMARTMEATPGGLSAGIFIGNPFTDVADLRSNSFVITDNDPERAEREAISLARAFWDVHPKLQSTLTGLDEAVAIAMATTDGTVVFTDAADATSSGASGDSSAILQALMDAGYKGRTLIPFVDPPAVEAAFAAGIGTTIKTTVGGQLDPRFDKVEITAGVRMLSDGRFINESHLSIWDSGRTAVLEAENHILVITSRSVSLYDRSLFLTHGQNPGHFDLVVVKSPHCQPQFFDDWAAINVNVDAPGSTSANLHTLGHRRCARPIFPLDSDVEFEPRATIYRRDG